MHVRICLEHWAAIGGCAMRGDFILLPLEVEASTARRDWPSSGPLAARRRANTPLSCCPSSTAL
eukprot:874642-Lingulodinium_polyedra.AAC.1